MKRYDDTTYGERIAEVYDQLYSDYEVDAVDLLKELGRGGRVLELGKGTGRIASPLRGRGIEVVGIDASEVMIEKLRSVGDGTTPSKISFFGVNGLQAGGSYDILSLLGWPREIEFD